MEENLNTDIEELADQIRTLLKNDKFKELKEYLKDKFPIDIAEAITKIDEPKYAMVLIRLLPGEIAGEVFTNLDSDIQESVVQTMNNSEIRNLMDQIFTDDIVDILEEMPENIVTKILKSTSMVDREKINQILQYDDDTAGSIMSVEYILFYENETVSEAIKKVRHFKDHMDDFNVCFVVDEFSNLKGSFTLKDLLLNEDNQKLISICDLKIVYATTKTDQEEVANIFKKYDITTLPIVNSRNKFAGIVTVDDVIDVMEEEITEDIHKMSGIKPTEDEYFKINAFAMARSRIIWLILLLLLSTFSQVIIYYFMKLYGANSNDNSVYVVTMLLFPIIIVISGTVGNAASQSSTMIVRGISLGEIEPKDWYKVTWKEFQVASICGFILIIVNFARMEFVYLIEDKDAIFNTEHWYAIALTSITLYLSILLAKIASGLLPLAAKSLKKDPTIMSGPLITTIVDTISTTIFFGVGVLFFI